MRVTRMGSHIFRILGVRKFRHVGILKKERFTPHYVKQMCQFILG